MNPTPADFQHLLSVANHIIIGKAQTVKLAVVGMLSRGHLLIEDVPGVGKTTLALTLSRLSGLDFNRVQFTNDLLPADLLGYNLPNRDTLKNQFRPGPVFANILLADEINRATPKTQSALLEAMEEHQVSIDGETHPLAPPFFVIATQNPLEQHGTFPLPESQLDRFLFCVSLGYPDLHSELALLKGESTREKIHALQPLFTAERLIAAQELTKQVHASDDLIAYVQRLCAATRASSNFLLGLSPRAALSLLLAAKSWAWVDGREFALPEDVREVFVPLARHRLRRVGANGAHNTALVEESLNAIMKSTPIP
jgi:MoxR-like ATPase